jgi:tetratricopeptide (TPR) repeat protein
MERRDRSQIFSRILREPSPGSLPKSLPDRPDPAPSPAPVSSVAALPGAFEAQRALAIRLAQLGDHGSAAELLRQAVAAAETANPDPVLLVGLHLSLAQAWRECGRLRDARTALDRAAALLGRCDVRGTILMRAALRQERAAVACREQDLAAAEQELLQALEETESVLGAEGRLCELHADLGLLYFQAGHPEHGLQTLLEGLALAETRGDTLGTERLRLLKILGGIAHRSGARDAALAHLLEAYDVARNWNFQDEMAHLEGVLGTIYAEEGNFPAAREWLSAAIRRSEQQSEADPRVQALLQVVLAQIETALGAPEAEASFRTAVTRQLEGGGLSLN